MSNNLVLTNKKDPQDVIKNFWESKVDYPSVWVLPQRRLRDFNWIISRLTANTSSLSDIGCGEGSISFYINQFLNLEKIYLIDQSSSYLKQAKEKWENNNIQTNVATLQLDIINLDKNLPKTDVSLFLGVIPYVIQDDSLSLLFKKIKSKQFIVRTPCTMNVEDELINKYSEELKSEYAAKYRTLANTIKLLSDSFIVHEVERIYPDNLDSKFGTKQFIFNCFARNTGSV